METGNLVRQAGRKASDIDALQRTGPLVFAPHPDGNVRVWERPLIGCRYLVSVRPGGAFKQVAGKRDRERSVVMVLRKGYVEDRRSQMGDGEWVPHRLVARLKAPTLLDATPLAEIVVNLGEWYGDALCFVEVKDGPICARECQRLGASVQVREVLDKASEEYTQELGWLSDKETSPAALNALVNAIRETAHSTGSGSPKRGALRMECEHCLGELQVLPTDAETMPLVRHDDDVRTLATGIYNIESATLLRADTRTRRGPQDGWKVVENYAA